MKKDCIDLWNNFEFHVIIIYNEQNYSKSYHIIQEKY